MNFNLRALIALVVCFVGLLLGLFALSNSVTVTTRADTPVPRTVSPKIATRVPRVVNPKVDVGRRLITLDEGVSLQFPTAWAVSGSKYLNAVELITKGIRGTESSPEARTLITVERRLNHDEAVDRLAEIASAHGGTVTYLSISGWPAMQVRYREPLPQKEERPGQPDDIRRKAIGVEERIALHTTTAIAVQDAVVRLDTMVAPKADEVLASKAEDIARKAMLPARSNPRDTSDEVERLRALNVSPAPTSPSPTAEGPGEPNIPDPRPEPPMWGTGGTMAPVGAGLSSETEAGVSMNGLAMIVASNSSTQISADGGATFNFTAAAFPFPTLGDPSVAVGRSGNFYLAQVGRPGAKSATDLTGLSGCSASVISSSDGGATFTFAGHAAFCPATGSGWCNPDQEKIAADRFNSAPGGGDQVYAVWRKATDTSILGINAPSNCDGVNGAITPSLSCSTNLGTTWSTPVAIAGGDYPRITVGPDGFLYVVMRDGRDVMLHKFTPCSSLLVEPRGFPTKVMSWVDDPTCPLPGLDRCGWGLTVPTVAVDDTNSSHVYVAVTKSTPANDDILVIDSVDGGLTWRTPGITVNASVSARRFMPWICTAAGSAYVGWYDRRAAAAAGASDDMTDFVLGGVRQQGGTLVPDGERNLTGTADAQCASGWPGIVPGLPVGTIIPPRDQRDSESCTKQPQLAGVCVNGKGPSSLKPCDYSSGPPCPKGESCITSDGGPKYGDYNGIACGPDRVLATWASATAPVGFTGSPPAGITVFADVHTVNGNLAVVEETIPANDPGRFNLLIDGAMVASSISNTTIRPAALPVTRPHHIGQSVAAGTSPSDYSVRIYGDCENDGTVHFSALHSATCWVTNLRLSYQRCIDACNHAETECMFHDSVTECQKEKRECTTNCSPTHH
jgi:hypothetical protein